jgi:hypothetical protein
MIFSTTKCEQFGHPEFVLEVDASTVPATYTRDLVETIECMVADGSAFRPGETKIVVDRTQGMTILNGDAPLSVVPGSFLDAWFQRSPDGKANEFYPE